MKKKTLILVTGMALVASGAAQAEWVGDAELGVSLSSGNTENSTANAKLDMDTAVNSWRHNIFGDAYYAEDDNVKTAERYALGYKPRYFFDEKNYVFGIVRYDQDEFAFIDKRTTEVLGVGRQFLNNTTHYLDGEIGAGARQTTYINDPSTINLDDSESIVFLGAKYVGRISDSARFSQTLRYEMGKDNDYLESITGLGMTVTDSISAKISYTVRNNSDVVGVKGEKTDTLTGINMVYSF